MYLQMYSIHGIEFEGEIQSLNTKTQLGEITILDHHRPLVSILAEGNMVITENGGSMRTVGIKRGFLEVHSNNKITVLFDKERKETI